MWIHLNTYTLVSSYLKVDMEVLATQLEGYTTRTRAAMLQGLEANVWPTLYQLSQQQHPIK